MTEFIEFIELTIKLWWPAWAAMGGLLGLMLVCCAIAQRSP